MTYFGFVLEWIVWIMECISTAHASVLIKGSPSKEFHLERGLQQGDPFSPFLFLLAAECVSTILGKAVESRG